MQDHIHVNSPCKLTCDALQILNNTQTHKTFLQLKISNPLDVSQTSCAASITLHAHNGQDYVFPQEPLALSLDAHASFEMEPLEISVQDVTGADVYIWQNADAHEANSLESDAIEPAVNPAAGVMPEAVNPAAGVMPEPAVEPTVNPTADVMPTMVMPSANNLADNNQGLTAQTGALNSDSTTAQPHTIGYVQAANASVPKQKAQKIRKRLLSFRLSLRLFVLLRLPLVHFGIFTLSKSKINNKNKLTKTQPRKTAAQISRTTAQVKPLPRFLSRAILPSLSGAYGFTKATTKKTPMTTRTTLPLTALPL